MRPIYPTSPDNTDWGIYGDNPNEQWQGVMHEAEIEDDYLEGLINPDEGDEVMSGRILDVTQLNFPCDRCSKQATFKIRAQNPHAFTMRIHFFCHDHMPTSAVASWLKRVGEIPE